jgi:D-aspartate ligase
MKKDKILMIGVEENPSIPFIHSLARKGLEIHVASYRRTCPGIFSRFPKKRYIYPSPFADEDAFVDRIINILEQEHYRVTLIFGEHNANVLTRFKKELEKFTTLPINDFDKYIKCRDKKNTLKIAQKIGVPTPKTYFPDEVEIKAIANNVKYPVVLKPNESFGARGISYPSSSHELISLYQKTREEYGECHIQEFIPTGGGQFKAEIFHDKSMRLIGWCVYEKIRFYPPKGGSSTFNRTVDRKDILKLGAKILQKIGWFGIGDCDFIGDPRDGKPKLMEINSRITRSIRICTLAGVDFPYMLYKAAIDEELSADLNYKVQVYMRYLLSDVLWFFRSEKRFNSNPGFFSGFFRSWHEEIFTAEDPLPFLGLSLSIAMEMLNKKTREYRLR